MPSLCFVAGDPSGDAHAALLILALKSRLPALSVTGLGGPAMRAAGAELLDDLTKTAAIGPFDAARHLGQLLEARRKLEAHLDAHRPDAVILVDFGDYNVPLIAPLAKRRGLRVLYYISPQVWAWGRWRVRAIKRSVDRMVVFFPFEEALYRREGVPVTWVGHPLVDAGKTTMTREQALAAFQLNRWRRTVGLVPGSREREVSRHLPLMLAAARRVAWQMPGIQILIPKAPTVPAERLRALVDASGMHAHIAAEGSMADALQLMDAALVASGTATLDAALSEVPMAVIYRTSWPTYLAAQAVLRVPRIGLVNIVAGRDIVPEFVQHRARPEPLARVLMGLLRDEARAEAMKTQLRQVRELLGPPGAIQRAAEAVLTFLSEGEAVRAAAGKS